MTEPEAPVPPQASPAPRSTGRLAQDAIARMLEQAVAAPGDAEDSAAPPVIEAEGFAGAVEAIADVTLAPVGNLRSRSWPLRTAALLHFASAAAAIWVAMELALEDWQVYAGVGFGTAVLSGNFLRWRRRWGWVRRAIRLLGVLLVDLVWGLLLLDRAAAGAQGVHSSEAASAHFAVPLALLCAGALLSAVHFVLDTKAARAPQRETPPADAPAA